MKRAPKQMMYRKDLFAWLEGEGYTEWQVRQLIDARVIRSYSWAEIVKRPAVGLPKWTVFLESQVRDALAEVLEGVHHGGAEAPEA